MGYGPERCGRGGRRRIRGGGSGAERGQRRAEQAPRRASSREEAGRRHQRGKKLSPASCPLRPSPHRSSGSLSRRSSGGLALRWSNGVPAGRLGRVRWPGRPRGGPTAWPRAERW
uniref:Uncharacterized protein n=1 Tax=Oryza nivara TaxID=4536 RepID=A0A0E0GHY7_ORYNI